MPKMSRVSKMPKMAVNFWAEPALPYWLRNERSFTIFFDLDRIFQEWPATTFAVSRHQFIKYARWLRQFQ